MKRSEFLKGMGLSIFGMGAIGSGLLAANPSDVSLMPKEGEKYKRFNSGRLDFTPNVSKTVSAIIIGAGNRGNVYAGYSALFPKAFSVIGVSDINKERQQAMARKFKVKDENIFNDFSEVFKHPKFADVVVISTPDDLHYEPCMKALEMGYDVLLEKPIAQTEKECTNILAQAKKYNRIVAVCHVLRYAPYFVALKQAVSSGMIGDVVSIQHFEPIAFDHMAHSYVRGNWHNSKESTPIILAKSCHDLDIIRWLIDSPCKSISADGNLSFFKAENAPKGSPGKCTDGCPVERQCPYSAINIYARNRRYLDALDVPKDDEKAILNKLKSSDYGKCVFKCNNDQPDHYVSNMTFKNGATAGFNMEAFTSYGGRRTRIMGTKGDIVGDMKQFLITDFLTHQKTVWEEDIPDVAGYEGAGHGGGDLAMVRDFVQAVSEQDNSLLTSLIDASVESHVMGFKAEQSRLKCKKVLF